MFAPVKFFNKSVWFILLSGFCISFVSQMVWPFMALILYRKFNLNEFEIGLYLAFAVTVRAISGFYIGNLSDRIGRRVIILIGFMISTSGAFILAYADNLYFMLLGSTCVTVAFGMVQNPSKALMTDMMENRDVKDLALQLKFFFHNAALALGPAIGAYLGIAGQQSTFYYTGTVVFIVFLVGLYIFNIEKPPKRTKSGQDQSFKALFALLAKDHAFMIFVLAYALSLVAYMQVQAGLLQYLRLSNITPIEQIYANLLMINGLVIIIFQFPMMHLLRKLKPMDRVSIAVSLFFISYMLYALFTQNGGYMLYVAMLFLALGEVILFPTIMILVDRMAPEHLKGSYFGAAGLTSFGVAAAPLIGGYLLQNYGGMILWLAMAGISIMVGLLFYIAQHAKRPDFALKRDQNSRI